MPTGLTTLTKTVQLNGRSAAVEADGSVLANSGDTLSLQYSAMATPAPNITWRRGSTELESGNDITIQTQQSAGRADSTLIVRNLNESGSGEYSAVADNGAGTVQSSLDVNIPGMSA